MKCLIIYGTLSGSTMTAAEVISGALTSSGNTCQSISVDLANKNLLKNNDVIIFGSPSWEDEGKDGQPLPEMKNFITNLSAGDLEGKKVALFGLGDTMYPHFCGAVDVMTEKLKTLGVQQVIEPLRIDRYYSLPNNEKKVKIWTETLAKFLI